MTDSSISASETKDIDLERLGKSDVLSRLGLILRELRSRGICRTDSFVAEIGEWWAKELLGLELEPPTTAGVDAVKNGVRYQIKTRRIYEGARSQRSTRRVPDLHIGDYDKLLLVILDEFFQCSDIFEMTRESVQGQTEATVAKLLKNQACTRVWPTPH